MIIADECLDSFFYKSLQNAGFEVNVISKTQVSLADIKIIKLSFDNNSIIITEDRDFGKFLFDDNQFCFGIIYLRKYPLSERENILALIFELLKNPTALQNNLVVIKNLKIRKRQFTK